MADLTLTQEVRDVLSRSTITENQVQLPEQLERPVYEAVNKALQLAGGRWNRKAKAHVFDGDPRVKLGVAMETGFVVDEQKKFQAFYTPPALAAQVVELADVNGKRVLEPSAGRGALVKECLAQGAHSVDCIELNPENLNALREFHTEAKPVSVHIGDFTEEEPSLLYSIIRNFKVNGKPQDEVVAKGLDWETAQGECAELDLAYRKKIEAKGEVYSSWTADLHHAQLETIDRIVMNPPFTRNQDITHVEHALRFLSAGGILVAIMPDNFGREAFQTFTGQLDALCERGLVYSFNKVPANTFADTAIKTIIIKIKLPKTLDGARIMGPQQSATPVNPQIHPTTFQKVTTEDLKAADNLAAEFHKSHGATPVPRIEEFQVQPPSAGVVSFMQQSINPVSAVAPEPISVAVPVVPQIQQSINPSKMKLTVARSELPVTEPTQHVQPRIR